jgi:very-short-patch-repair endonuclease
MADEMPRGAAERKARLAALARRQWGNVTAAQLRKLGFSRHDIAGMVRRGELIRIHRGVYAIGHVSPAPEAKWAAALLAAGREAALSHLTALALHGLIPPRTITEVTASTQRRGDDTLKIHHAQLEGETTRIKGLRATTLPRTFIDVAATGWPIDSYVHEATASGLTTLKALRRFALVANARPGTPALRRALALPHLRSRRERALHAELLQADIEHTMNHEIGRMTVDAFVPALNLVLELDHENTHGTAFAIERDARRDAELERRGYTVARSTEIDELVRAARAAGP